jgi:hypothetical protein
MNNPTYYTITRDIPARAMNNPTYYTITRISRLGPILGRSSTIQLRTRSEKKKGGFSCNMQQWQPHREARCGAHLSSIARGAGQVGPTSVLCRAAQIVCNLNSQLQGYDSVKWFHVTKISSPQAHISSNMFTNKCNTCCL